MRPTGGLGDWAAGWLSRAALALSVLTAVVVAVLFPVYQGVTESSDGTSTEVTRTLIESMGLAASLVTLVPAVLLALPLVVSRRLATGFRFGAALALTAFCVLGALTIGLFFVPVLGLAWAAVLAPGVVMTGPSGRRPWRIVAGLLVALPVVLLGLYIVFGTFGSTVGAAAVMLAAVVVAIAVGAGRGWAYLITAAGGLVLLVMAVVWGGMLMLGVWWVGGLWLDIGLAATLVHRATRTGRTQTASAPGDPRA